MLIFHGQIATVVCSEILKPHHLPLPFQSFLGLANRVPIEFISRPLAIQVDPNFVHDRPIVIASGLVPVVLFGAGQSLGLSSIELGPSGPHGRHPDPQSNRHRGDDCHQTENCEPQARPSHGRDLLT
jgi:hypothetical protein